MSGDRFVFNFYHNWSSLILWNRHGIDIFLHSREGVTQGWGALAMIAYGIGVIPMIKLPKEEYSDVTQPWYVGYTNQNSILVYYKIPSSNLKRDSQDSFPPKFLPLFFHTADLEFTNSESPLCLEIYF